MQPTNLLFIISDQHTRNITGAYGHPMVQTPNIDCLAERGTRFNNAYTTCPICVPARASLATGRYVHQIGYWDNGHPYEGNIPSWGHRLREQGYSVDSIGKLHFRREEDDLGFTKSVEPLNVVEGIGDIMSCLRENPPFRRKRAGILEAGPGDSTYLQYDARNEVNGLQWLADHANDEKPWALFLSFVCPHPPYIAPQEFYDLYPVDQVPLMMPQWQQEEWPDHPTMDYFRRFFGVDEPFNEAEIRRLTAAYFGMCTYLDQRIGNVLDALEQHGLTDTTRVVYTSDHGESLSARGLYGKFTMHEESVAVPFIMAGPDVPQGKVSNTPISFADCFPTIVEAVGGSLAPEDSDLPGESLWAIAQDPDQERTVFSEYHAVGVQSAVYMLRDNRYKYIYHVGAAPQLFDLEADPNELNDLIDSTIHQDILSDFEGRLRSMMDPEGIDAKAKADQRAKVEAFGGVEAVIKRGAFTNSPAPGEEPKFNAVG